MSSQPHHCAISHISRLLELNFLNTTLQNFISLYNLHNSILPLLINTGETLCDSTSKQNQDFVDIQDIVCSPLLNKENNSTLLN